LYEKASSDNERLSANAEKWSKYEENKRAKLLEMHPESDRENLSTLDLNTLEYVTSKINQTKPNAPEVVGKARNSEPEVKFGDFKNMSKQEKREKWDKFMKQYKPTS
jgi:hypothetical protein